MSVPFNGVQGVISRLQALVSPDVGEKRCSLLAAFATRARSIVDEGSGGDELTSVIGIGIGPGGLGSPRVDADLGLTLASCS